MEQELLLKGIQAIKTGQLQEGRQFLLQILKVNPRHELAWLWMSSMVENQEQREQCLQKVLQINPQNQAALQVIAHLSQEEERHEKEDILEGIIEELQQLKEEIRTLRSEVSQIISSPSSQQLPKGKTNNRREQMEGEVEAEEAFLDIFDWLASRNITVKDYKQPKAADHVFDNLSMFLGERFSNLKRVHDQIRRNLNNGESFTLSLSSASQSEISDSTQFCTTLHDYAFLASYRYNKQSRTIRAQPQRLGKVINFFTGGWFERYVFLKVTSLLQQSSLNYVYLRNPQISLPNGDDFELDLLFLIENEPLWIECKTGDYAAYINRYSQMRKALTISEKRSLLVILGIQYNLAVDLTKIHPITVTNENNFMAEIAKILEIDEFDLKLMPNEQDEWILADDEDTLEGAYHLLTRAVKLLEQEGGEKRGSIIKSKMIALHPAFNEKDYGFEKFKNFLEQAAEDNILWVVKQEHGDYYINLIENQRYNSSYMPPTHNKNDELMYLIYWAIKANLLGDINYAFLSPTASTVRKLNPNFELYDYGYSRNQGFRAIIEDAEKRGFIRSRYETQTNKYYLYVTEKFEKAVQGLPIPTMYHSVRLDNMISKLRLRINLNQMSLFINEAISVLQSYPTGVNAQQLLDICLARFERRDEKIRPDQCMRVLMLLFKLKCIRDQEGSPIISVEDRRLVAELDKIETLTEDYIQLLIDELKKNFDEVVSREDLIEILSEA